MINHLLCEQYPTVHITTVIVSIQTQKYHTTNWVELLLLYQNFISM